MELVRARALTKTIVSTPATTIASSFFLSSSSAYSPHFPAYRSTNNMGTAAAASSATVSGGPIRIAVVGDTHDDWDLEEDCKALRFLQADLVLLTGDFGNENVDIVKSISKLEHPKAAILGNHDAWRTHEFSCKKKDSVQLQMELLKEQHVGYRRLDFPQLKISVVGGRPFSCGGERLFRPKLLSSRYGVYNMEDSAKKICKVASGTPQGNLIVVLAHNGPTGLGSNIYDICGKDWVFGGGDHGDADLTQALAHLKSNSGVSIPLVVFGHMHKALAYGGLRKMIVIGDDGTVYLNGAIVPRVKPFSEEEANCGSSTTFQSHIEAPPNSIYGTSRAFTMVEIQDRRIRKITETWVSVVGNNIGIAEETTMYEMP